MTTVALQTINHPLNVGELLYNYMKLLSVTVNARFSKVFFYTTEFSKINVRLTSLLNVWKDKFLNAVNYWGNKLRKNYQRNCSGSLLYNLLPQ